MFNFLVFVPSRGLGDNTYYEPYIITYIISDFPIIPEPPPFPGIYERPMSTHGIKLTTAFIMMGKSVCGQPWANVRPVISI
jgi:hypothetical protein